MRKYGLAAPAALFVLWAPMALASDVECHANDRFHVAARAYPEEPGTQFAVTPVDGIKPKGCVFDAGEAQFVIGQPGDPLWFAALEGKYLVMTRSTGPQGDLVVHDLESRKVVLDVPADEFEVKNGRISFWERTGEATQANCPAYGEHQANGLGSVIAGLKHFDLDTLAVTDTKKTRCDATQ